jgi:tRNA-binding protein
VSAPIDLETFASVEMRVGTVVSARLNERARVPAYVLEVDFGPMGVRTSSAQLTQHYAPEDLIGRRVVAVVNLPARRIAGVKSEVLVLGSTGNEGTLLLTPSAEASNGARIG